MDHLLNQWHTARYVHVIYRLSQLQPKIKNTSEANTAFREQLVCISTSICLYFLVVSERREFPLHDYHLH